MVDIKVGILDFIIFFVQAYGYFIKSEPQLANVIKVEMIDVPLYVDVTHLVWCVTVSHCSTLNYPKSEQLALRDGFGYTFFPIHRCIYSYTYSIFMYSTNKKGVD